MHVHLTISVAACSVQYLQQPEAVFAEMHRVLKPGGVAIVSFSNRLFYEKAIAAWRQNTDFGRQQLVKSYFQAVVGFSDPDVVTGVRFSAQLCHRTVHRRGSSDQQAL